MSEEIKQLPKTIAKAIIADQYLHHGISGPDEYRTRLVVHAVQQIDAYLWPMLRDYDRLEASLTKLQAVVDAARQVWADTGPLAINSVPILPNDFIVGRRFIDKLEAKLKALDEEVEDEQKRSVR